MAPWSYILEDRADVTFSGWYSVTIFSDRESRATDIQRCSSKRVWSSSRALAWETTNKAFTATRGAPTAIKILERIFKVRLSISLLYGARLHRCPQKFRRRNL